MSLTIGSLCSGYGGLDLAVESVLDARTAWVSDIDKGACKVLAHRFPHAPNIGDMTAVDWAEVEPVDIITGGTPCQDLSHAGKRAGMTEGTRSNLWVAMREAIATIRPRLVIWENVGGAYSAAADSDMERREGRLGDRPGRPALRALGRVLGDLASLGYVGGWHGLRAADVGAPHGRLRVFVVAVPDAERGRLDGWAREARRGTGRRAVAQGTGEGAATDADGRLHLTSGARTDLGPVPGSDGRGAGSDRLLPSPRTSDTNGAGRHGDGGLDLRTAVSMLPTPRATRGGSVTETIYALGGSRDDSERPQGRVLLPTPLNADAGPRGGTTGFGLRDWSREHHAAWGQYAPAIQRWEAVTREAPAPTELSTRGTPRLSPAFTEWMMGLPAGWITDVPGITRNEALKLCGNGVVPQQAEAAIRFLLPLIGRAAA